VVRSVREWSKSSFAAGELRRSGRGADKEETMSKTRTLKVGLTVAAALLMLSACQSSTQMDDLERRVGVLEGQADSASARASQMEAAANQCTATCQEVEARANRMMQQSQMK
jgi:Alanine-zipper, major outer membrane lipoprotein